MKRKEILEMFFLHVDESSRYADFVRFVNTLPIMEDLLMDETKRKELHKLIKDTQEWLNEEIEES